MIRTYFLLLCLAALSPTAAASEEDSVPLESLLVSSIDLPDVGVITVEALSVADSYSSFEIRAFGRARSLSDVELKRLAGFPLSSLSITHEAGYTELGGHTVHIRLRRSLYDAAKVLIHETILISIPKNAELQISVKEST